MSFPFVQKKISNVNDNTQIRKELSMYMKIRVLCISLNLSEQSAINLVISIKYAYLMQEAIFISYFKRLRRL